MLCQHCFMNTRSLCTLTPCKHGREPTLRIAELGSPKFQFAEPSRNLPLACTTVNTPVFKSSHRIKKLVYFQVDKACSS